MLKLEKLEFRRLFTAKSFLICLAISLVLILISSLTTKFLLNALSSLDPEDAEMIGTAALQMPSSLSLLKEIGSSSLTLILAIFVTIFVTEDYTSDTIKNVYAKGYSRDTVYFAKYLSSLTGTLLFLLADAIFAIVVGKLLFGEFGTAGENYAASFLACIFVLIAYHTVYFTIAISLRKTGGSIALCILGPILVGLLLSLANTLIKSDTLDLAEYWLPGRLSILSAANVASKEVGIGFAIAIITIVAFGTAGFFLNRKRES